MIKKNDHDHDHDYEHDRDPDPANDNGGSSGAVAPAPSEGALAALTALGTTLNTVDTASVVGRSGMPMLSFKREGDGTWMHGQKKTVVEDDSLWAVNPTTFKRGYICFSEANKVLGEKLLPVSQPMPDVAELPDHGSREWQPQWAVNLKCIDGADADVEVIYKPTTDGGIKAVAGLIDAIRDRINGGMHDGKVSPIVHLEKGSYQNAYGKIWYPVMDITDWMPLSGPTTAPKSPSPPPVEQPRRRRVA